MSTKEVDIFAIKADQQSAKLVDPGKAALTGETLFVNIRIEQAFTSAFRCFAVPFVFDHVGNRPVIEADFAGVTGIEGTVSIEKCTSNRQSQWFHHLKGGLKMGFQTKSVVMIARYDAGRGHHIAIGIRDGQNIAGFSPLAGLVSHTFAAFLSDCMAAIEVQLGQIQVRMDRSDAGVPNTLPTAVRIPFLPVIVDGLPTDFFFSGLAGLGSMGNCAH